jgi:hypothetical protein
MGKRLAADNGRWSGVGQSCAGVIEGVRNCVISIKCDLLLTLYSMSILYIKIKLVNKTRSKKKNKRNN